MDRKSIAGVCRHTAHAVYPYAEHFSLERPARRQTGRSVQVSLSRPYLVDHQFPEFQPEGRGGHHDEPPKV
jgi:hypothetical protein